ncbi:MAG: T9SS type A sorting domain-containing protein [Bacteroidia bacterium]
MYNFNFSATLVAILIVVSSSINAQSFRTNYLSFSPTGSNTKGSAAAIDYDGDGDMDVLGAYQGLNEFMFYENIGVSFKAHIISTKYKGYNNIEVGDFNNDSLMDYLVVHKDGSNYNTAMYVNDGNYNYNYHSIDAEGYDEADRIEIVDMDGDGDQDILMDPGGRLGAFAYLENQGNLSFKWHSIQSEGFPSHLLAVADVNEDGYKDVFASYYNLKTKEYEVVVYEQSTSSRSSYTEHKISTFNNVNTHCVADNFFGDSKPEFVLAPQGNNDNGINIYRFNDDFTIKKITQLSAVRSSGLYLPYDYNADDSLDLLYASNGVINILKNNHQGNFQLISNYFDYRNYPKSIADFNNDGKIDFLNLDYSHIEIGIQNDQGNVDRLWKNNFDGGENIIINDIDGNGKVDIATTRWATWNVNFNSLKDEVLPNESFLVNGFDSKTGPLEELLEFDYDNDGDIDYLTTQNDVPYWVENDNGTLKATKAKVPEDEVWHYFKAGDFDNDMHPDFINVKYNLSIFEWRNGKFHETALPAGSRQYDFIDVDNDGDNDVVYIRWNSANGTCMLSYVENDNNNYKSLDIISLAPFASNNVNDNESELNVADINNDGYIDIFILSYEDNTAIQLLNNGDATFTGTILSSGIPKPTDQQFADIDNNGFTDVLVLSRDFGRVYAFLNDSNKTYTQKIVASASGLGEQMKVADIDNDGDIDIVTCSYFDRVVALFENQKINCPRVYSEKTDSFCQGDSISINGNYFKNSITHTDTFSTQTCDSVHITHYIKKDALSIEIVQNDSMLILAEKHASTQWYKDGILLNNETDSMINANLYGKGQYFAEFIYNDCLNKTNSIDFEPNSLPNAYFKLKVYPNPVNQKILIKNLAVTSSKFTIYDNIGRKVLSGETSDTIDIKNLPKGSYSLILEYFGHNSVAHFIKN